MTSPLSTVRGTIAATQLLLISPAALFMTALVVRNLQPQQYEPAHSAQQIVAWYAARPWTLWVMLMAMPFVVLVTSCATLLRSWHDDAELRQATRQTVATIRAHLAVLFVAVAMVAAAGVLAIVALHSLAD